MEMCKTTILRFKRSERFLHWSIALPFLGCLSTALFLVLLSETDSTTFIREMISRVHKIFGISLIISPLIVLISHWYDLSLHIKNIKEGWLWSLDDIKWIALMPLSLFSQKVSLPEEGKFNAGEKINIMMTMAGYFCFSMTGIFILSGEDVFLSSSIHFFITFLSVPVITGHIFMATLNPDTRKGMTGMITGFVDRNWASHHYRRWFNEKFASERESRNSAIKPASLLHSTINSLSGAMPGILFLALISSATFVYLAWLSPFTSGG